ncbi:hypothetical protein BCD_1413 (plasmid) [Borrelia crocidurae DOU]|uniref:Uncharacterized protein n=1 Tax=Borrelia crocidurae DOU TaxID=1293575 RepID=W5SK21_9SPIR|nr:hypothetical protein BCD_1413 [Borrelia crocidurae DOU]
MYNIIYFFILSLVIFIFINDKRDIIRFNDA